MSEHVPFGVGFNTCEGRGAHITSPSLRLWLCCLALVAQICGPLKFKQWRWWQKSTCDISMPFKYNPNKFQLEDIIFHTFPPLSSPTPPSLRSPLHINAIFGTYLFIYFAGDLCLQLNCNFSLLHGAASKHRIPPHSLIHTHTHQHTIYLTRITRKRFWARARVKCK